MTTTTDGARDRKQSMVRAAPQAGTIALRTCSAHAGHRLGFAVKVLGGGGLPSHDSRRWQSRPHLAVSLARLERIFDYLERNAISMYRMSSSLVPYGTHLELPQFHGQVERCRERLTQLGEKARALDLRLSFHPGQYVVVNSESAEVRAAAVRDLEPASSVLDTLGLGRRPQRPVLLLDPRHEQVPALRRGASFTVKLHSGPPWTGLLGSSPASKEARMNNLVRNYS